MEKILIVKNGHPVYALWYSMNKRCYNASPHNYPFYQGKGIKVSDEWLNNREKFFSWCINNGWKQGLSLDRIDSNKDYSPNNCQFLTISENTKKRVVSADTIRKNRTSGKKLSINQVTNIKILINIGMRLKDIANEFKIDPSYVSKIKLNKRWRDFNSEIEVNIINLAV
jgi:hypothetical protein